MRLGTIKRFVQVSMACVVALAWTGSAQAEPQAKPQAKPRMSTLPHSGLAFKGATVAQVNAARRFLVRRVASEFGMSTRAVGRKLKITSAGIHNYGPKNPRVLIADGEMKVTRGPNRYGIYLTAMGDLNKRGALDRSTVGLASGAHVTTSVKIGNRRINFAEPLNYAGGE